MIQRRLRKAWTLPKTEAMYALPIEAPFVTSPHRNKVDKRFSQREGYTWHQQRVSYSLYMDTWNEEARIKHNFPGITLYGRTVVLIVLLYVPKQAKGKMSPPTALLPEALEKRNSVRKALLHPIV